VFFYDLKDQPWGYDPKHLDGSRVVYFPPEADLAPARVPDRKLVLPEWGIRFTPSSTVPIGGSRDYDRLKAAAGFSEAEEDKYGELAHHFAQRGRPSGNRSLHQMLGHAFNIQGDMQLEAQLVTHGLYAGNEKGYKDPRRPELEKGADEWMLLLQLDSDESADVMWGDSGMLYFWIREADLRARRFEKAWMTLQCY
jgi:uncharacterized protein YwqG